MTTQYAGLDIWSETIDHVTDDDTRDASAYAISAIGLADRTRFLKNHKLSLDGGTVTGNVTIDGNLTVTGTAGFNTSGEVLLYGRKAWYRGRVSLSDASQTVGVNNGDRFDLPVPNGAARIITLDDTTVQPNVGETMSFFWNPGGSAGAGTQFTFKRDDGTVIATFVGAQASDTGAVFAEFEYVLLTFPNFGWRLGHHSGTHSEYTPSPDTWTSYGVVPGAGA